MKMKILWTHNFPPEYQDAGIFMHQMHSYLSKNGMEIDLLYLGNLRSLKNIINAIYKVRKLSKEYDIVHSQFGSMCGLITSFAKTKKIISIRGSDWHKYNGPDVLYKIHNFLSRLFTKISLHSYKCIIVMSVRIKDEIKNAKINRGEIFVVTDPIDLELFRPKDKRESRNKYFGGDMEKVYVLFATLEDNNPVKRISLAKKAIKIAKNHHPNIEIAVATGLPHSEMPDFISACDLILSTSYYEGWPNCIKEGLACGIPFISLSVSDLDEIAKRRSSCKISKPDPEKIAKDILLCLRQPKDQGLREEVEDMSFEKTYKLIDTIYKNTLSDNKNF
tara:strand:+ start:8322 stop:9320 length:999 start_codon:yes stop_codon:yes gene_type:complete